LQGGEEKEANEETELP